ncbi:hypothetical protein [Lusitaniella coriacea]|nr:hypothetical protein [Lusitaniella coriacea]
MSMQDAKALAKELRFKFNHDLEEMYHRFFDELAQANLPDGEAGKLAQILLLSRQEGLKYLVSKEEMEAYSAAYPSETQ